MTLTGASHAQRILELLAKRSALDDDEISTTLNIKPRQQVNQICQSLERGGLVHREYGPRGKIVNIVLRRTRDANICRPAVPQATVIEDDRDRQQLSLAAEQNLSTYDLTRTLVILPCSGKKMHGGSIGMAGPRITDFLPPELSKELLEARSRVKLAARVNETRLMPTWQRYTGSLYRIGGRALESLIRRDCHVLVLSGGYGVVLATELIGYYEAVLNLKWWPNRLLERVIEAYLATHHLPSARAFASRTTAYQKVIRGVSWRAAGVGDALLFTPDAVTGAMTKSPSAQGEALGAFVAGTLTATWKSSTGLGIAVLSLT
jgi:hypothetical protein